MKYIQALLKSITPYRVYSDWASLISKLKAVVHLLNSSTVLINIKADERQLMIDKVQELIKEAANGTPNK